VAIAASLVTVCIAAASRAIGSARRTRATSVARAGVGRVNRWWGGRNASRRRRLNRLGSIPLPNLYTVHPDARRAMPREIGLRAIDVDQILGTAVAGVTQRGSDFKPLPAFRSANWVGRYQRVLRAVDALAILPPIDVYRFPRGGGYWVTDGHNRVAAALEIGQVEIDANVAELVPIGENASERPAYLAPALTGTLALRAAGQGGPLESLRDDDVIGIPPRVVDTLAPPPDDGETSAPPASP
jgi:hypothetical protein